MKHPKLSWLWKGELGELVFTLACDEKKIYFIYRVGVRLNSLNSHLATKKGELVNYLASFPSPEAPSCQYGIHSSL